LGAVFDSDPTDADFDLVSSGNITVGIVTDRVGGAGLVLGTPANRVQGSLGFANVSLFSNGGVYWLRWLSLAVSLGLMAAAWFGPRFDRWEQMGYGLILGGALGNGIDRFLAGHVVDFLDFRLIQFPIFNLADVSINLGILCLLISSFFYARNPPRGRPSDTSRDKGSKHK